nr:MAG TPA: hypothetical protein [Caudoviricetes sp.]
MAVRIYKIINAKKWGTGPIKDQYPIRFISAQYHSILHSPIHLLRLDTCQCGFQDLLLDSARSQVSHQKYTIHQSGAYRSVSGCLKIIFRLI